MCAVLSFWLSCASEAIGAVRLLLRLTFLLSSIKMWCVHILLSLYYKDDASFVYDVYFSRKTQYFFWCHSLLCGLLCVCDRARPHRCHWNRLPLIAMPAAISLVCSTCFDLSAHLFPSSPCLMPFFVRLSISPWLVFTGSLRMVNEPAQKMPLHRLPYFSPKFTFVRNLWYAIIRCCFVVLRVLFHLIFVHKCFSLFLAVLFIFN